MSNLIIPAHSIPRRVEIKLPPIEVPKALREDFEVNPHMEIEFYRAVGKAVSSSLNREDTALRAPSEQALKDRIESCYKTMLILRMDLKFPLRKCFDLLPQKFIEALVSAQRPEDLIEKAAAQATAWAKGSEPQEVEVSLQPDADLAIEAETNE